MGLRWQSMGTHWLGIQRMALVAASEAEPVGHSWSVMDVSAPDHVWPDSSSSGRERHRQPVMTTMMKQVSDHL